MTDRLSADLPGGLADQPAGAGQGAAAFDLVPPATRRQWLGAAGALAALMGGCAIPGPRDGHDPADHPSEPAPPPAPQVIPFSTAVPGRPPAAWRPYAIRRDLARTRYGVVREAGRGVLHARAKASATGLICAVDIDPAATRLLNFSWRVREVPRQANVGEAVHDDCPARLIVAFAGDDSRLSLRERLFFDQVELFTGQRLPYATLMYVWDGGRHAVNSLHRNHRTSRIQYLTVESGAQRAGQWLPYQRDVVADYRRAFGGEAPGRIVGVGVLTDTDALKLQLDAWYGDISLGPVPAAAAG